MTVNLRHFARFRDDLSNLYRDNGNFSIFHFIGRLWGDMNETPRRHIHVQKDVQIV